MRPPDAGFIPFEASPLTLLKKVFPQTPFPKLFVAPRDSARFAALDDVIPPEITSFLSYCSVLLQFHHSSFLFRENRTFSGFAGPPAARDKLLRKFFSGLFSKLFVAPRDLARYAALNNVILLGINKFRT